MGRMGASEDLVASGALARRVEPGATGKQADVCAQESERLVVDDVKVRFKRAFNTLAVATRLPAEQADAAMQQVYFAGLEDLPIDALELAAGYLAQTAQWFPKLAEWRDAAKIQRAATLKALPPGREEHWKEECEVCSDSGWELRTCHPGTPANCGRKNCQSEHAEHSYVTPCCCRPTNRTYMRTHQFAVHG